MSEGAKHYVSNHLARTLGKEILLEAEVDTRLLGGVVLHVGDTAVDGSLRRRLDALSKKMRDAGMDGERFYED